MDYTRIQLTLFVDPHDAVIIEQVRRTFNPVQYALIRSHVTLCREDELVHPGAVLKQLESLTLNSITIHFGPVTRFADGKGVMLPVGNNNAPFHALREIILADSPGKPRLHQPHLTLMHPRNATCTNSIFEQIKKYHLPARLTFRSICLIQQTGGVPWKILREYPLAP